MRLCDTHGEIRAAYSALLEVVPTHLITRSVYGFSHNVALEGHCPPYIL